MSKIERDKRTRRAVIDLLKVEGSADVKTLAEHLELTPMAVRLHIHQLRDEKLVEGRSVPRPKGRPATVWSLTASARQFFPDGHEDLVLSLLDSMRRTFGEEGVEQLLSVRTHEQIARYRTAMRDADSLEARLEVLAKLRTAEGYMACVERNPAGDLLFVENHCPICAAAQSCQKLCASELDVFRAAIGDLAYVERTDHIIAGARRCAYKVTPVAA